MAHHFVFIGVLCLSSYLNAQETENENKNRFQGDWMKPYHRPPGYQAYNQNQFGRYQDRPSSRPTPNKPFGSRPPQFSNEGNSGWNSQPSSEVFFPGSLPEGGGLSKPSNGGFSTCLSNCVYTQEFNPICGSDGKDYSNMGELGCNQKCGNRVSLSYHGSCRTTPAPRPTAKTPTGMYISPGRVGEIASGQAQHN